MLKGQTAVSLAETNYHMASARLEKLDQQIASSKIFAPRDGRVLYPSDDFATDAAKTASRPRPGAIVRNRQAVIHLADPTQVNVNVPTMLRVAQRVTTGQAVTILLDALPGRTLVGHITQMRAFPEVAPGSNEAVIIVRIDDPPASLKPGMAATVEFDLSQASK